MSKYNDILIKHRFITSAMNFANISGLIIAVICFGYMAFKYGISDKTVPTLFLCLGTYIFIVLATRLSLWFKYGKVSNLVAYRHDIIKDTIDYLLNGNSYNPTINEIDNHINKINGGGFSKDDLMGMMLETHCGEHRNNVVRHISILKIAEVIKKLN